MSQVKYAIGVDLGTSKVRVVMGCQDGDEISLLDYEEEDFDQAYEAMLHGKFANRENAANSVNRALLRMANKYEEPIFNINTNFCNIKVKEDHQTESYTLNGKKFTINEGILDDFAKVTKDSFRKKLGDKSLLHLLPQDFFVDEVKLQKKPSGTTGNKLSCNFKYLHSDPEIIDDFYEGLQHIKVQGSKKGDSISIDNLIFNPLADALALLSEDDKREGVVVINVGAGMTQVSVFKDGAPLFFRIIPFGGNNITDDIKNKYRLNVNEAEKLKKACMYKTSKRIEINEIITLHNEDGLPPKRFIEKNIADIAEWRLREIIAIVHEEIKSAGLQNIPTRGFMLSGEMAKVACLSKIVSNQFETDAIRIGVATKNITSTPHLELAHPKYATVVGLVLSSFVPLDNRMNAISVTGINKQTKPLNKEWWKKIIGSSDNEDDPLNERYGD